MKMASPPSRQTNRRTIDSADVFEAAGAAARDKAEAAAEAGSAAVEKERSRREAGREEPVQTPLSAECSKQHDFTEG